MNGSYEREAISRRYPNNEKSIQLYPSPEFLNSLAFIKKFYPVLNLLHAPRVPQKQRGCSLLHLLAIRTHSIPSVRKFALPAGARGKLIKVTSENSSNSRHSERLAKESSLLQYKAATKNENNSSETVFSHFTSHVSLPKIAFTLAEVLITLGIIGVVAAITLPSLIQHNIEKQRVVQLKKAYSELSQAYNLAVEEFGAPTEWGMGGMYEEKSHYIMANNMRKFLKLSVDCVDMTEAQTEKNCGFKGAFGGAQGIYNERNYKYVVLNDGTLVQFRIISGACNWPFGAINNVCGGIDIDINGATPPNRNGEDIFYIFMTRNKLVPAGIDGASLTFERACNRAIKVPYSWYGGDNMYSCTAWVLYNENMDYLHCDGLSWAGKHSCKE